MINNNWYTVAAVIAAVFLSACNTIEIREESAFDAHRTITPERFNVPEYTLHEQSLITSDGEHLDSWFLEHENAAATVLYMGGNGFLMVKSRPLIEAYARAGVNLMLLDYRGYGMSSGTPSVEGLKKDVLAAFEVAANKRLPVTGDSVTDTTDGMRHKKAYPIFIHGHSMGSLLAGWLAERKQVSGYVLESPISNVSDWTGKLVPFLLRPFIRFDVDPVLAQEDNMQRVASIRAPMLIIAGESDEITPVRMATALYEASGSASKRKVLIPEGGHNDLPNNDRYAEALHSFFRKPGVSAGGY
ncbi:alpha/beta fold hydrolase [Balneolales bacterium ANBcel1]|nr:alpha/beta fold hydrolase [Balneolales bacterium ANBcel1]